MSRRVPANAAGIGIGSARHLSSALADTGPCNHLNLGVTPGRRSYADLLTPGGVAELTATAASLVSCRFAEFGLDTGSTRSEACVSALELDAIGWPTNCSAPVRTYV